MKKKKTGFTPLEVLGRKNFSNFFCDGMTWVKEKNNTFRDYTLIIFKRRLLTGFTLIEVLVAIFVLVVGIVAVLNIFPLGLQVRKGAEMSAIASWLGQEKIEEIVSISYGDIPSGPIEPRHFLDPPYNNYERETVVSCVEGTDLSEVNCDVQPTPLKKIKATVFWKPPFKLTKDKIEIVTLIVKK